MTKALLELSDHIPKVGIFASFLLKNIPYFTHTFLC